LLKNTIFNPCLKSHNLLST